MTWLKCNWNDSIPSTTTTRRPWRSNAQTCWHVLPKALHFRARGAEHAVDQTVCEYVRWAFQNLTSNFVFASDQTSEATKAHTTECWSFDSFWLINDAQTNEAKVWPRLQCAFECRVLGVSCILHRLTQLAAFFLDQRAEWSTTISCYCLLD